MGRVDVRTTTTKRISGLHYTVIVKDSNGVPVTKMMFTPEAAPVVEVWDYLEYLRVARTSSFNTLKRVCEDLMHFYDYMLVMQTLAQDVDLSTFSGFVEYLLMTNPHPNRRRGKLSITKYGPHWSIERSLWEEVPVLPAYRSGRQKIVAIRPGIGLDTRSISRMVRRAAMHLEWLKTLSPYNQRFSRLDITALFHSTESTSPGKLGHRRAANGNFAKVSGYLAAKGISGPREMVQRIEDPKIAKDHEVQAIDDTTNHPRDRFLYFMLQKLGLRIGEALGLQWVRPAARIRGRGPAHWDFGTLAGDIRREPPHWIVRIEWRPENPPDRRAKAHTTREVAIMSEDRQTFEALLDRYLQWRWAVMLAHKAKEHNWIFVGRTGAPLTYNAANKQFHRAKLRAGLSHRGMLSLHSYRHYKITTDRNNGIPMDVIAQEVGHANTNTTEAMYWHADPKSLARLKDKAREYYERRDRTD